MSRNQRQTTIPEQVQAGVQAGREVLRERVVPALQQAGHQAREQLEPYVEQARGAAEPYVDRARDVLDPYVDRARDVLEPYVEQSVEVTRSKVLPAVESAVEQARETTTQTIVPKVAAAMTTAAVASAPARKEAKVRGAAALAALKGQPVVKPKRRWGLVIACLTAGAAAGAAAAEAVRRMTQPAEPYSSAPRSMPAPAPAPTRPSEPAVTTETTVVTAAPGAATVEPPAEGAGPDVDLRDETESERS